jgi:hypothetical protein
MKKLLFLILCLLPFQIFATDLMKNDACKYADGIYYEPIYIYWPGEAPYVESFVKSGNKLYYFIHTFQRSGDADAYRANNGRAASDHGWIPNKASQLVEHDCVRSKVTFHPTVQDRSGLGYGKFLWKDGKFIGYTFSYPNTRYNSLYGADYIFDLEYQKNIVPIGLGYSFRGSRKQLIRSPYTPY